MISCIIAGLSQERTWLCLQIVALFYWSLSMNLLFCEPFISVPITTSCPDPGSRDAADILWVYDFLWGHGIDGVKIILIGGGVKRGSPKFYVATLNL